MELSERIKKLGRYFNEMQIIEENGVNIIYVAVTFPSRWIIDEDFAKKKSVTVVDGNNPGQYYFCTELDGEGSDAIFDVIDDNIEKMKEAIERAKLLETKTRELKNMFENEEISIEKLRTLRFCYDGEEGASEELIITKGKEKDKNKK